MSRSIPGSQLLCPAWSAGLLVTPLRLLVQPPARILAGLVLPGQTVADLGAGPGYFTVPMAQMVGERGRVLAVDLQPVLLQRLARRAERAGVRDRIELTEASAHDLHIREPVDFALAFFMVHEVPDVAGFMRQVAETLKPGGKLLVTDPIIHVSRRSFEATVALAEAAGLRVVARPRIFFSHAALLRK